MISGEEEEVSVLTSSTRDEEDFRDIEADALFDLPPQLLDLIDAVDPLFDGDSNDKAKAHDLLQVVSFLNITGNKLPPIYMCRWCLPMRKCFTFCICCTSGMRKVPEYLSRLPLALRQSLPRRRPD